MKLWRQRIPEKNDQIHLIMLYLCADLLFSSQMSGKKFVDAQIGNLLDQTPGGACGIQIVFAQNPPVGDAEILHQLLF